MGQGHESELMQKYSSNPARVDQSLVFKSQGSPVTKHCSVVFFAKVVIGVVKA
jgi:hypothetical protein